MSILDEFEEYDNSEQNLRKGARVDSRIQPKPKHGSGVQSSGAQSGAIGSRENLLLSKAHLQGDEITADSTTKIDRKDFNRWTGFGGGYLAKLIEILTDLSNEGTEKGDAFHLQMMQALLVNHEVEELTKYSL